jgi:CheY-like chemotaxis protein
MKLRLTSRIALFFVLLVAVLLAAVGALAYRNGSESLKAAVISEMLSSAVENEAALNAWIEERLDDIAQIASQTDVVQKAVNLIAAAPGSEQARSAHAVLMLELEPHVTPSRSSYIELFVMEPEGGKVVASTNPDEEEKSNHTNRQILGNQIAAWKMQVGSAAGGDEALARLRAAIGQGRPYDVALLDVQMPKMDGLALAAAIKSDPVLARTRLIVLTSMGHVLSSAELKQRRIEAYLVKPVRQSRLLDCLIGQARNRAATDGVPDPITASSPGGSKIEPEFKKVRILLAEDNIINQQVALGQLRSLRYRADAVANGREVLEALQSTPYDLILMDCQMPEMDGYEAAQAIRQRENRSDSPCPWKFPVHIIAVTANAMQGEREKCLAAGMDDYLSKPVRSAELQAAIARWQIAVQYKSSGDNHIPPCGQRPVAE